MLITLQASLVRDKTHQLLYLFSPRHRTICLDIYLQFPPGKPPFSVDVDG